MAANIGRRLVSSRGAPLDHRAKPWERIQLTKWWPILDATLQVPGERVLLAKRLTFQQATLQVPGERVLLAKCPTIP